MSISSRPELSTCIKVSGNRTNYAPLDMTDDSVYDLAVHWYTAEEIAETFNVSAETVLALHGDAFRMGKANHSKKPRILHGQMTDACLAQDFNDPKIAAIYGQLGTKLIEMQWRKQEGYGQKSEVAVTHSPVSPSDFKFSPLTLDNKDEPWTK